MECSTLVGYGKTRQRFTATGNGARKNANALKRNAMNPTRKSIMEKIETNPDKYNKCWSKPWTDYTWRELLELWAPEINTKPH
jgi:hypothetical protein